jgi:hypothetical protein
MVYVNDAGYLARGRSKKREHRDWWLVKAGSMTGGYYSITAKNIMVPHAYFGKRIRFKVEVLDDKQMRSQALQR